MMLEYCVPFFWRVVGVATPSLTLSELSEAVSNNCFYEIGRQLIDKQHHYGTRIELVDRWYPSPKTCSKCGNLQPMPLKERVYNCNNCGHTTGRDVDEVAQRVNAAINLEKAPEHKIRLA